MQKNNKNTVLGGIQENRLYSFILQSFLISIAFSSFVSYAQRLDPKEDLDARITTVETQLANLIGESSEAESYIAISENRINNIQSQLDEADVQLTDFQNQAGSLRTIISAAEISIPQLISQKNDLGIEISALSDQITQLTQQRLDIANASIAKETELLNGLSIAKSDYIELQQLGDELIAQFDNRLAILNQYLDLLGSNRLGAYIERYITLLTAIRERYAISIESSKSMYSAKIVQIQEEVEQLRTETTVLLAVIDQELINAEIDSSLKQEEINSLSGQIIALNDQKNTYENELASVTESINVLHNQVVQLSEDLGLAHASKLQLVEDNEVMQVQIELLQSELAGLLELQEERLAGESREQKIAKAIMTLNNLEMNDSGRCQANNSSIIAIACFASDKQQIVRITHLQLLTLGIDLSGVPKKHIGALNNGKSVPVFVSATDLFEESSFIEVLAEGNDSIYSDNTSYLVYVDFEQDFLLSATSSDLPNDITIASNDSRFIVAGNTDINSISNTYTETFHYEKDDFYSISGLSDYGWTDTDGFHYINSGQTKSVDVVFELDSQAQVDHYASLVVKYAKSAFINDSVKTLISLNGVPLGNEYVDQPGRADTSLELEVSPGLLQIGENTFSLSATNAGAGRMSFQFDEFTLSYQRRLVAKDEALVFTANTGQHLVSDFVGANIQNVVVFKQAGESQFERIAPFTATATSQSNPVAILTTNIEPLNSSFVLEANNDTRFTVDQVNSQVELIRARNYQDILSPEAEYLIISHADFINTQAMSDLVNLRQTEYSVQVVDVDQIYAQYAQGSFDAHAIKEFIGDKISQSSTEMVLLVGDDTYDYKNRLETGEKSFIPSMYLTYPKVMAADSIYVDQNNDQLPDIAIGRFPVENVAEFSNMVEKTISFSNNVYSKKAVLATNYSDGYGESHYHPLLKSLFHSSWSTIDALMAEDTIPASESARSAVLDSINYRGGSGLMVYTGHNSYSTGPMFSSLDLPLLANHGIPTTAVMIDSFTGFYIADQFSGATGVQAEDLLTAEGVGAAAVFAPSSTVGLQALQTRFIWRISRNYTYGEAYLNAMQASYRSNEASYNLLGDPGLRLSVL